MQHYIKSREQLYNYQARRFNTLVKKTLIHSPFYRDYLNKPFEDWPIINKQVMNDNFDQINTANIKKNDALTTALKAEETRDFSPLINQIAVGLSSGTSGKRGLFLTNPRERDAWAGIILAKILPNGLKSNERIAFFLRANNSLYTTLNKSRRIQFHFFDLLNDFDEQINQLNIIQPTILSAPSSVLYLLAKQKHRLTIKPQKIVAVAEVLEKTDEQFISQAFKIPVSQVYQCTEGFLAVSDKESNKLIMNEEFLIIEKEWIDEHRFTPVITDLMRTTQPVIRYRLDDVLVQRKSDGIFTELSAIDGRLGDICYGKRGNEYIPIFADMLRQSMASSSAPFDDYCICQTGFTEFSIQITPELTNQEQLIVHLNKIFEQKGCDIPTWSWIPYEKKEVSAKQRRIQSKINMPSIALRGEIK